MSPDLYGSSTAYALSGRNSSKTSDFFKTFGNGSTNSRTLDPQQANKNTSRNADMGALSVPDSSFFDFEPATDPGSPYHDPFSTPGASGMPWVSETSFHPLSPPNSASFPPKDPWAYPFQQQNLPNLFTNVNPANTRAQYGQVTPPDDGDDNISLLDLQLQEQQRQQLQLQENETPAKKRKLNISPNGNDQASQPAKRSRKYASRGSNVVDTPAKPEDVKRSKFLERNRVAASKCRQKKKEWTQNLENRARELQKNNNMLRMNVESLRQEILFLKGEMLKHSNCDCDQIQVFMKSGASNFLEGTEDGVHLKREPSPLESMPGSPGSRRQSSLQDSDSSDNATEHTVTSIVNDENALEALLSSSIISHDTSDEGIASQVAD